MILTCPSCETKFLIAPEALGETGRKVRYGNCGNAWHQEPQSPEVQKVVEEVKKEQEENLRQAVKDQAEGIQPSLPTVVEDAGPSRFIKAAVGILIILNFFAFLVLNRPLIGETGFHKFIGDYETSGVSIINLHSLESMMADTGINKAKVLTHYIQWDIANKSSVTRRLPTFPVKLYDASFNEVSTGKKTIAETIEPGVVKNLLPVTVSDANKVGKYVVVDVGSPADLMRR